MSAMAQANIIIDEEFARLAPSPSPALADGLERSLLGFGYLYLHPLIVWAGPDILLDGHRRFQICQKHGFPFRTKFLTLPDRQAAQEWTAAHQLEKRNVGRSGESYLRGKLYQVQKTSRGGNRPTRSASEGHSQNASLNFPHTPSPSEGNPQNAPMNFPPTRSASEGNSQKFEPAGNRHTLPDPRFSIFS